MAVDEIGKPAGVRCTYLGAHGCGIYATRPESCRVFACGWLNGVGTHKDRPDRAGVMLVGTSPGPETVLGKSGVETIMQAHEVNAGALGAPGRAVDLAKRVAAEFLVVVMTTPRRVIGPDGLLALVQGAMRDPQ